mmetsp:Transcript_29361/g.89944  ORF Transcript_29361/g.89944 Transcript_29361/m.89944 type:complete len:130 (+) Transcript_29361:198-587(+)|eukprot:scaffold20352_cov28-Tisochrysis_lutea.AAC.1
MQTENEIHPSIIHLKEATSSPARKREHKRSARHKYFTPCVSLSLQLYTRTSAPRGAQACCACNRRGMVAAALGQSPGEAYAWRLLITLVVELLAGEALLLLIGVLPGLSSLSSSHCHRLKASRRMRRYW